jgi:hypothetical protein
MMERGVERNQVVILITADDLVAFCAFQQPEAVVDAPIAGP